MVKVENLHFVVCSSISQQGGPMADLLERPDYSRVTREVRRIHDEFAVANPPIDPVYIARSLGVSVHFVTFSAAYDDVSGFYDSTDNAIYVNSREFPLRQTFTVAHELGHSIMHREWARSTSYKTLMRDQSREESDHFEKEANAFAAHLLVPRFLLDRYARQYSAEQLSRLFAVSVPMIKARLGFEYGY
jgi:Zn-dependent peptidase ImmA (M78 family)